MKCLEVDTLLYVEIFHVVLLGKSILKEVIGIIIYLFIRHNCCYFIIISHLAFGEMLLSMNVRKLGNCIFQVVLGTFL